MPASDYGYTVYDRVAKDVIEYCRLCDNEFSRDLVHEDDLHLHNNFNAVFFDTDVKLVYKLVRLLSMVCKRMENRFINRDTVRVSRSLFHYIEKKRLLVAHPSVMYDFKFGDVRILVIRDRKKYRVKSFGVYENKHESYTFDTLEGAIRWFAMVVRRFVSAKDVMLSS